MSHGHVLQKRWDGVGTIPTLRGPPFVGMPALEITHPFHFKMSPAMLLGPKCNHDLGILLRLPTCISSDAAASVGDKDAHIRAMKEAV